MQSPELLQNLGIVAFVQIHVDQLTHKKLHRRPLLLLNCRSLGRIDVIDSVLDKHTLGLANVLNRLLALQCL